MSIPSNISLLRHVFRLRIHHFFALPHEQTLASNCHGAHSSKGVGDVAGKHGVGKRLEKIGVRDTRAASLGFMMALGPGLSTYRTLAPYMTSGICLYYDYQKCRGEYTNRTSFRATILGHSPHGQWRFLSGLFSPGLSPTSRDEGDFRVLKLDTNQSWLILVGHA